MVQMLPITVKYIALAMWYGGRVGYPGTYLCTPDQASLCAAHAPVETRISRINDIAKPPKAPAHLRPATRKWFEHVLRGFELEQHHIRLLHWRPKAWDRAEEAREALAEHGLTFMDRFDCPRARPEVAIERDSRIAFARLIRELDLDVELPPSPRRPAMLRSNRRTNNASKTKARESPRRA